MDQGLPGEEVGEEGLRPAVLVGAVGGEAVHGAEGVHQGARRRFRPWNQRKATSARTRSPKRRWARRAHLASMGCWSKRGFSPPAP